MHEECGVFAVAGHRDAAYLTYIGLLALQHHGQEACGIVSWHAPDITRMHKDVGSVVDVFGEGRLHGLKGTHTLGHVRYSTKGRNSMENAQPHKAGEFWVASNGDIVNYTQQRLFLQEQGLTFISTNDGELLAKNILFNSQRKFGVVPGILQLMEHVHGTYSAGLLANGKMYAFRDPMGIRPLVLGRKDGAGVLSSESCALDAIGAEFVRRVNPGEIVDLTTLESLATAPNALDVGKICIFEHIYFARPDSVIRGELLWECRRRMGAKLAQEDPEKDSEIVIPVPETGNPAAVGFAQELGIPLVPAIIKNHYVGRTFITAGQEKRREKVRIKLNVMKSLVEGKRIKVIEDSIVRGTTTGILVEKLKQAGAAKVSLAISSPPIKHPCFYGVDTGVRKDLIASEMNVEQIRDYIGADALQYLSLDGLLSACGDKCENFCTACLTGDYPIPVSVDGTVPSKAEWEAGRQGA